MANQRTPPRRRESDLQRVYDFIAAFQPDHLRAASQRFDRRTRWLIVFMVASMILLWSVIRIAVLVTNHVAATSGPFLFEALRAPYHLEDRQIPVPDSTVLTFLPAVVGEYTLQQQAVPVTAEAAEQEIVSDENTAPVVTSLMGGCLSTSSTDKTGCVTHSSQRLESGIYQGAEGVSIYVTMAQFASDQEATQVTTDLHRYGRAIGSIGNYGLEIGAVDYFYSSTADQYAFVWSHGSWVYVVASSTFEDVESLIQAFPY